MRKINTADRQTIFEAAKQNIYTAINELNKQKEYNELMDVILILDKIEQALVSLNEAKKLLWRLK